MRLLILVYFQILADITKDNGYIEVECTSWMHNDKCNNIKYSSIFIRCSNSEAL